MDYVEQPVKFTATYNKQPILLLPTNYSKYDMGSSRYKHELKSDQVTEAPILQLVVSYKVNQSTQFMR